MPISLRAGLQEQCPGDGQRPRAGRCIWRLECDVVSERHAEIFLGQSMAAHRNRRTWMRRWTARPCEGRSGSRRSYRLWTCYDRLPHSGLAASAAIGLAMISRRSGSVVTASTRRPAGEIAPNEPRRMAALPIRANELTRPAPRLSRRPIWTPIQARICGGHQGSRWTVVWRTVSLTLTGGLRLGWRPVLTYCLGYLPRNSWDADCKKLSRAWITSGSNSKWLSEV